MCTCTECYSIINLLRYTSLYTYKLYLFTSFSFSCKIYWRQLSLLHLMWWQSVSDSSSFLCVGEMSYVIFYETLFEFLVSLEMKTEGKSQINKWSRRFDLIRLYGKKDKSKLLCNIMVDGVRYFRSLMSKVNTICLTMMVMWNPLTPFCTLVIVCVKSEPRDRRRRTFH